MRPVHRLPDRLATEQFVLRSFQPGDGRALRHALVPSYDHLRPWMPWAERDPDPDELDQRVRVFRARWLLGEDFVVSVWDPSESAVLGGTGFHLRGRPLDHAEAEIGMWIAAPVAGRGLGKAVLTAMLGWGFDTWGFERLEWLCAEDNAPSRRVAEACGMAHEGTRRGVWDPIRGRRTTLAFALTADAWRA